jgi:LemA protein
VQGYAGHERSVLQSVTEARARVTSGGTVAERAAGENALSQSLRSMFAVAESYPELRASANFLSLQEELAATENRIAAARRFYNANVRDLNTRIEVFPSSLIAAAFRFRRADYFELDDTAQRIVPRVDLG